MILSMGNKNIYQKRSFKFFLSELLNVKMLLLLEDICRFFINKDKGGKIKMYEVECRLIGERFGECVCFCRLLVGSVQLILGKLLKLIEVYDRGKQWDLKFGFGNLIGSL